MTELQPCGGCRRHIEGQARVCPFCGVFPRLSRAAVFAGIALASTACGGTKPTAQQIDNQQQQQSEATADAGVELPPAEPDDEGERRRRHRGNNGGAKMPYGAPPASRRLV